MKKTSFFRVLALCLMAAMVASSLFACSGQGNSTASTQSSAPQSSQAGADAPAGDDLPPLEYSFFTVMGDSTWWADPSTDVVSSYIFDKFNISVSEVVFTGGIPLEEKITVLSVADSLPDVLQIKTATDAKLINDLINAGYIAKLDDYISPEKTPNIYKYITDDYDGVEFLRRYGGDGGLYGFPQLAPSTAIPAVAEAQYKPLPVLPWNIIIRSDLLREAGYSFNKYSELAAELADSPRPLTLDDLKMDPPIETPDDFYDMLVKLKNLNAKVGDKDVIPFSIQQWQLYHFGSTFGSGLWSRDPNGQVNGFYGHQYAKDYWQYVRKLYGEGLLDPDFAIQTDEQFIQKASSGLVGASIYWCSGDKTVFSALEQTNPDYEWVRIAMPHLPDVKPYTDEQIPSGTMYMINSKFSDVERLVNYFDWFYSDEALDVITWGPESAGLYTMVDGKKQFADPALWELIKNGTPNDKGFDYYGLYTPAHNDRPGSLAVTAAPFMQYFNPFDSRNSYPYENDFFNEPWGLLGQYNAATDGSTLVGTGSEAVGNAQNFMWSNWLPNSAPLYTAKSDADFDAAWDQLYNDYMTKGMYEQAQAEMEEYFKNLGI